MTMSPLNTSRRGGRIKVQGLAELRAKVQDPALLAEPLQEFFTEAVKLGQKTAVDGVDGGRGVAVRTILTYVNPMSAKVVTVLPKVRADSIDKGRKRGVNPRAILAQMINWRNAVGHPETGIEIAVGIRQKGVKARKFIKASRDAVADAMPNFLQRLAARIEGKWES